MGGVADKGNRDMAQKLMGAGAAVGNALHEAIRCGHEDIWNDLLESGASVDTKDASRDGRTLLHLAAAERTPAMVLLWLLKGANKNARDKEHTPLCLAAAGGHVVAAVALMAAGADASLQYDLSSMTVLHVAA